MCEQPTHLERIARAPTMEGTLHAAQVAVREAIARGTGHDSADDILAAYYARADQLAPGGER